LSRAGYTIGEDGRLRRGRSIVSAEDAARTLATQEADARYSESAKAKLATDASRVPRAAMAKTEEAQLLAKIEAYLRPVSTN